VKFVAFWNTTLQKIYKSKREEVTKRMDNIAHRGVFILHTSANNIRVIKSINILYSWSV
jgi:hypothetical protein